MVVWTFNTVSCSRDQNNLLVGISETQLNKIEAGELTARNISEIGFPDTALLILANAQDQSLANIRALVEIVAMKLRVRHVFYVPLFATQVEGIRSGLNFRIDLDSEAPNGIQHIYLFYGRTAAENDLRLECSNLEVVLNKNIVVFNSDMDFSSEVGLSK